jgi:hypothetical protein
MAREASDHRQVPRITQLVEKTIVHLRSPRQNTCFVPILKYQF